MSITYFIMILMILFCIIFFLTIRLYSLKKNNSKLQNNCEQYRIKLSEQNLIMLKEQELTKEKLSFLQESQKQLTNIFESAGAKALERNNRSFLTLATETFNKLHQQSSHELKDREKSIDHLLLPMKKSLSEVDKKLYDLEKNRESAYQVLKSQVNSMIQSQKELQQETANLTQALRTPHIRGRWGEIQLKRVVEISGMSAHCDFIEQATYQGQDNSFVRPDMVINLPGNKKLIIDAKAPLNSYLDALNAKDESIKKIIYDETCKPSKKTYFIISKKAILGHHNRIRNSRICYTIFTWGNIFLCSTRTRPNINRAGIRK